MKLLRPILALLAVALPIWFANGHVAHHSGDNPFLLLHAHLNPEGLLNDPHSEPHEGETEEEHAAHRRLKSDYVLLISLPEMFDGSALSFFDMYPETPKGEAGGHDEHDEHDEHEEPTHDEAGDEGHDHADEAHGSGEVEMVSGGDHDPVDLILTNLQLFQLAAAVLLFICFMGVPKYLRTGKGDYMSRLFAGFAAWVRDEMVYPVMGKETGQRFLPLFLTVFFFILFMNMLGLVPGSATATASIFVTAALAVVTFAAMLGCGMAAQGPFAFWKNLVPHVPAALWPLMFVVEVVGLCIKPFALMIRLFANMSGGHLVVLSFMGLIFYFAQQFGPGVGWASSPVALGFAVFIMIIEFFVAMLQAYVFTQLSILFVHSSVHPDH